MNTLSAIGITSLSISWVVILTPKRLARRVAPSPRGQARLALAALLSNAAGTICAAVGALG